MPNYHHVLFNSSESLNLSDWNSICNLKRDPFMDPRFLKTLETAFGPDYRQWMAILYDETQQPVAAACFSSMIVDGAMFAPSGVRRGIERIRKFWSSFLKFKLLVGGLPISSGQFEGQIALTPDAEMPEVVRHLDEIAVKLAKEIGSVFITIKEFAPPMIERLEGLTKLGYRKCESVVTYTLPREQATFQEYYETRSKRTRANMRKVFKKLEESDLRVEATRGGDAVAANFTPEMHELYTAVFERSDAKFEYMPVEFFRQLARNFPEDAYFTFIYQGKRPVAFCCALAAPQQHNLLYCGIDYALNPEFDLYFNTLYKGLEQGFQESSEFIKVGASADEFKKRLGTFPTQLSFFVKVIGIVPGFCFRALAPILFSERKPSTTPAPEEV